MNNKLFVFFGPFGYAINYLMQGLIDFSSDYVNASGEKKPVSNVEIKTPFSEMKEVIISSIVAGNNMVLGTRSESLLENLVNDPEIKPFLCIVYVNVNYPVTSYVPKSNRSDEDLAKEELEREARRVYPYANKQKISEIASNEYETILKIKDYFNNKKELFTYTFLYTPLLVDDRRKEEYNSTYFHPFYEALLNSTLEDGTCWLYVQKKEQVK